MHCTRLGEKLNYFCLERMAEALLVSSICLGILLAVRLGRLKVYTGMSGWGKRPSLFRVQGYGLCSVLKFHNFSCNVFALTRCFEMSSLGFGLEKHSKTSCLLLDFP